MNDQSPDPIESPGVVSSALTGPDHDAVKQQIETILDLDTILSSASRAERTQPICTNGSLKAAYDAAIEELGELVDAEGNLLTADDDASYADGARAAELQRTADDLLKRIRSEATVYFRFRALPSDEFDEFDASHRTGSDKRIRDTKKYENELIAKCAINPPMDVAGVVRCRKEFGSAQVTALFNAAFYVNKADGIDVPKSPSFLHALRPPE